MKLYTEEQVKEAIKMALHGFGIGGIEDTIEVVASKFTPIELPTDEEIYIEAQNKRDNIKKLPFDSASFQFGAIWLRDKIGGNNE